jgi:transformation/transcription domain-associated protein
MQEQGVEGKDAQGNFTKGLESLWDAIHFAEITSEAEGFLVDISRYVFSADIRQGTKREPILRRYPSSMLTAYLDALPQAMTRNSPPESDKAQSVLAAVLAELFTMEQIANARPEDIINILHQLGSRFSAMCLEDLAVRRNAGCSGIKVLTDIPAPYIRWIYDRDIDITRTLLHALKDLPTELPPSGSEVVDLIIRLLRLSDTNVPFRDEVANAKKLVSIISIFFADLSSPNPLVREAVQKCIGVVSELSGKTPYELLLPHRDRILQSLYTKPLRALPYAIQIGVIEAIRYCVSLEPALPEVNDELMRLLHETLALAGAKDVTLMGRGGNPRGASLEIVRLKMACIRLLSAAIPITDCYAKHSATQNK